MHEEVRIIWVDYEAEDKRGLHCAGSERRVLASIYQRAVGSEIAQWAIDENLIIKCIQCVYEDKPVSEEVDSFRAALTEFKGAIVDVETTACEKFNGVKRTAHLDALGSSEYAITVYVENWRCLYA
jgi:hypothetical protein